MGWTIYTCNYCKCTGRSRVWSVDKKGTSLSGKSFCWWSCSSSCCGSPSHKGRRSSNGDCARTPHWKASATRSTNHTRFLNGFVSNAAVAFHCNIDHRPFVTTPRRSSSLLIQFLIFFIHAQSWRHGGYKSGVVYHIVKRWRNGDVRGGGVLNARCVHLFCSALCSCGCFLGWIVDFFLFWTSLHQYILFFIYDLLSKFRIHIHRIPF